MIKISPSEFAEMRSFLADVTGISLAADKSYLVESRLTELLTLQGFTTFQQFIDFAKKKSPESDKLRDTLVDAMTTNETTWFRDEHPFIALKEKLLPAWTEELQKNKRLKVRIWCAAASSGQEPYSIAIIIQEYLKKNPSLNPAAFDILATDLSSAVLESALKGRYDALAMSRGMPKELAEKYFSKSENGTVIHESIRKMVTFRKFNLMESFQNMPLFDLIFLRNVTIYFDDAFKRALFAKMAGQLTPTGFLFLGAAESLWGYSEAFDKQTHGNSMYYQVKKPA